MVTLVRKLNTNALVTAILIIALGLAMLISPRQVYRVSVLVIIGYLLVIGLINLFNGFHVRKGEGGVGADIAYGIFYLVIAAILYLYADKIVKTVPFILGIIIMLAGFSHLFQVSSNPMMQARKRPIIIYSCVLIAISLFFIFQSMFSLIIIFRLYGVTLIATGVIELMLLNYLKKGIKDEPKKVEPI